MKMTPKQIIQIAKEFGSYDQIDWDGINADKDLTYDVLASSLLEKIYAEDDPQKREILLVASVIDLLVENFVLSIKQQQDIKNASDDNS